MTSSGKYTSVDDSALTGRPLAVSHNDDDCSSFASTRRSSNSVSDVDKLMDEQLNVRTIAYYDVLSEEQLNKQRKLKRRTARSVYGESPDSHFGPKAILMSAQTDSEQVLTDPGGCRLAWQKRPLTVLIIKKPYDHSVNPPFVKLVKWLVEVKHLVVFVEESVLQECRMAHSALKNKLTTFSYEKDSLSDKIDFIICLGGDGTLLYASSMFQKTVPPVMAFHLGSLGFLSPFTFEGFEEKVSKVLEGGVPLVLRTRLKCTLCKHQLVECASERDFTQAKLGDKDDTFLANTPNISSCHTDDKQVFLVLNEVVIDRGQSPFLSNIDLFVEHKHVTTVQGDGLIISTPTGSTAYAAAAGASMIHPNVPAILIAPICPHSLSFRPIVVPAGVEIKIQISEDTRSNAWLSFDGRNRQEMKRGDVLRVQTSTFPVPWVCGEDHIADWFQSLAQCLHWNVRERQHSFTSSSYNSIFDTAHTSSHSKLTNGGQTS